MASFWKLFGEWATGLRASNFTRVNLTNEVSQIHKRFMADASHELRTPLSIIKANSEIALSVGNKLKTQDALSALQSNAEEADRMSKIIESLMSFSYYDSRINILEYEPMNLSQLIEYLVEKTRKFAQKKYIEINLTTEPVTMVANRAAIEEAILNILKNSIDYSPVGGRIDIKVGNTNNNASISIRDNGIGIDPQDLLHVFDPFYKSSAVNHYNKSGSGLGLAIVKKIIDRHKGSINIDSRLGNGTLVLITLPL